MTDENKVREKKHFWKKKEKGEKVSIPSGKKRKKTWIAVLVIAVIVIGFIGTAVKNMTADVEVVANTVEIAPVEYRDLSNSISIKGTVSGASKRNVVSMASAEVSAVNVQVGDMVAEGDILVTLDSQKIEEQISDVSSDISNANAIAKNEADQLAQNLSQAQADQTTAVERATSTVNQAQADCDDLQKKYNNCADALATKKNELTNAQNAVKSAKSAMNSASAALTAAKEAADLNPNDADLADAVTEAQDAYDKKYSAYTGAETNAATISAEVDSLQAKLDGYEASLDAAKDTVEAAKQSYDDTVTSSGRNVASAQNAVDMSKYQTTDNGLEDTLDDLKQQLSDCSMAAPCGGVVTAVNVSVGDNYTAGTTMITIEDTSSMKVIVTVEEADILKLQEGMRAIITTDATGDEELEGTVTRVVRVKNQSSNPSDTNTSTGYSAEISIENTELLVGMSAKAKIMLQEKPQTLAVPYDLIRYDENQAAYVLVAQLQEDGTAIAVRKDITVGEEVDYYVEVIHGDLKEGDMLIYDYSDSIAEGQTFTPEQLYSDQNMGEDNDTALEAEE